MERSAIRESEVQLVRRSPDFATLHPGYKQKRAPKRPFKFFSSEGGLRRLPRMRSLAAATPQPAKCQHHEDAEQTAEDLAAIARARA